MTIITHSNQIQDLNLEGIKKRLKKQRHLALPLEEELSLLYQLTEFELGRFLLKNKGLNGHWTAYLILHGPTRPNLDPLEKWLLHDAPVVKATQDRFKIFQQVIQNHLQDNMFIASIPCGLMDDLIRLDYNNYKNIKLYGIDLDEHSINSARENANNHRIKDITFVPRDAWGLKMLERFDLITSNGLNIYEPDDQKVIALYKEFNKALKVGGTLIISFLTPPPIISKESPWKDYKPQDLLMQKAVFSDIIQANWQAFRTERQMHIHLKEAGFKVQNVIYDSQSMFPTMVAEKV